MKQYNSELAVGNSRLATRTVGFNIIMQLTFLAQRSKEIISAVTDEVPIVRLTGPSILTRVIRAFLGVFTVFAREVRLTFTFIASFAQVDAVCSIFARLGVTSHLITVLSKESLTAGAFKTGHSSIVILLQMARPTVIAGHCIAYALLAVRTFVKLRALAFIAQTTVASRARTAIFTWIGCTLRG